LINLLRVRGRILRIFLALFWFVWTAIIIPAHSRGAISVPGSCCHCSDNQPNSKSPTNRSPANCAVCQLAAHLMPAITIPIDLEPGEQVELVKISLTQRPILAERPFCFLSRGPPTLA
jgi:hypothetical protein